MSHVTPNPVQEHLAGFRSYLSVTKGRQPGTVDRYVQAVAAFLEFLPEGTDLSTTRRAMVIAFLEASARMEGGSPSSHKFNGALAAVRAFFLYLNRIDVMESNPTTGIDRHQVRAPSRLPLTLDEYLAPVGTSNNTVSDFGGRPRFLAGAGGGDSTMGVSITGCDEAGRGPLRGFFTWLGFGAGRGNVDSFGYLQS